MYFSDYGAVPTSQRWSFLMSLVKEHHTERAQTQVAADRAPASHMRLKASLQWSREFIAADGSEHVSARDVGYRWLCHAYEWRFNTVVHLSPVTEVKQAPSKASEASLASNAIATGRQGSSSRTLTRRQYEVLALLAAGHPMKDVAYRLGITYRTVTFHKYTTMQRLGITTNAALIAYALNWPAGRVAGETPFNRSEPPAESKRQTVEVVTGALAHARRRWRR